MLTFLACVLQQQPQPVPQHDADEPAFVKIRRAADARERAQAGTNSSDLAGNRWERRQRARDEAAQQGRGSVGAFAGLSLDEKATYLAGLAGEEQERVLKELPTEEVSALFQVWRIRSFIIICRSK